MKLYDFLPKLLYKVTKPIFRKIGFDEITYTRINPRNDMQNIGSDYGGWVIPADLLDEDSVCYCAGCGEDITFDTGLIEKYGCYVYGFDPTPRAVEYVKCQTKNYDHYRFFDIGLWDHEDVLKFYAPRDPGHVSHSVLNLQKTEEYFEAKVNRLSKLMSDNRHNSLDLLKLDIEGAEYKVIDSIIQDNLDIKILCVEFDESINPIDRNYAYRIKESMQKLINYGYSLVYVQGSGNYTLIKNV